MEMQRLIDLQVNETYRLPIGTLIGSLFVVNLYPFSLLCQELAAFIKRTVPERLTERTRRIPLGNELRVSLFKVLQEM